ncbi:MAG: glycine cleavage system protein R [Puniceicoccaceae bacterium]
MNSSILLITISGKDRPGIVGEIAAQVARRGGNWERSRLIHLAGRFVGLLQISVPEDRREDLRVDLLSVEGLAVTVAGGRIRTPEASSSFHLDLVGADHPGIVSEIFGKLSALGLNVESLSTWTEAAADSGTVLFRAGADLSSAEPMRSEEIIEALEALANDLLVEVSVSEPS